MPSTRPASSEVSPSHHEDQRLPLASGQLCDRIPDVMACGDRPREILARDRREHAPCPDHKGAEAASMKVERLR